MLVGSTAEAVISRLITTPSRASVGADHGKALVGAAGCTGCQPFSGRFHRAVRLDRAHLGRRTVPHQHLRQIVRGVLGLHRRTPARQPLGHDGAAHAKQRHQERAGAAGQEWQQPQGLPGGLKGKHHTGKQGARCAGEDGCHSHQCRHPWIYAGGGDPLLQRAAQEGAEPATDGEQGGQGAPRGAAAQRDGPGHKLGQHQDQQRGPHDVATKNAVDVVVADAQRVGHEIADGAHRDGADRGPPHPVNGQLLEPIFDCIERPRHQHRAVPNRRADQDIGDERGVTGLVDDRHGEDRRASPEGDPHRGGRACGQGNGNERAGPVFEEQQLDGQKHG